MTFPSFIGEGKLEVSGMPIEISNPAEETNETLTK